MKKADKEIKKQVISIVEDMEQAAAGMGMKQRVLDSLREIRQGLWQASGQEEWDRQMLELDACVAGMKKQVLADEKNAGDREEAARRIQEILNQCGRTNSVICGSYAGNCQMYLQDTERKMRDLTNIEADFTLITSASAFCDKMSRIGQKYDQQITEMAYQYIDEASENYDRAIQKMKQALTETGCAGLGPSNKELYHWWAQQSGQVQQSQKADAEKTEKGARKIGQFAQEHAAAVQKIVAKESYGCLMIKLFPVFLLLLVFIFRGADKLQQSLADIGTQTEAVVQDAGTDSTQENVFELLWKFVETFGIKRILLFVAEMVMLLGLCWYVMGKYADRRYKKRICAKAGEYLAGAVEAFWQQETLKKAMEGGMEQIEENLRRQYQQMFEDVFGGSADERAQADRQRSFMELCSTWDCLNRM